MQHIIWLCPWAPPHPSAPPNDQHILTNIHTPRIKTKCLQRTTCIFKDMLRYNIYKTQHRRYYVPCSSLTVVTAPVKTKLTCQDNKDLPVIQRKLSTTNEIMGQNLSFAMWPLAAVVIDPHQVKRLVMQKLFPHFHFILYILQLQAPALYMSQISTPFR